MIDAPATRGTCVLMPTGQQQQQIQTATKKED
jgi:hypothetical protein